MLHSSLFLNFFNLSTAEMRFFMSFAVLLAFTGSSQGKYMPRLPVSTEILIIVQNEESFHLNWQFSLH